jgi:hypothetical protein
VFLRLQSLLLQDDLLKNHPLRVTRIPRLIPLIPPTLQTPPTPQTSLNITQTTPTDLPRHTRTRPKTKKGSQALHEDRTI